MVTQMITLKLESKFLERIDEIVKHEGYQNRTEFIRNALHTKVDDEEYKRIRARVETFRGISKKQINDEEYETVREEAAKKVLARFK